MMCGGFVGNTLGLDITGYEEKKKQAALAAEAQDRATRAAMEAARVAEQQAAQQAAMQANFAMDLSKENLGTVVAGGSAEQAMAGDMVKRKQKKVTGLSSALGINL